MYATDFEYDGQNLSDYHFIICRFGSNGGTDSADKGSEISFKTAPTQYGKRVIKTGSLYEKCLSSTFQICKDPEYFGEDEMIITPEEFRKLSRWLNRRDFLWFHAFDPCEMEIILPWFRASFNLSKIDSGGSTIGVSLDMLTDSPFGFGALRTDTLTFTAGALSTIYEDYNEEIGECYPEVTITCGSSADLSLKSELYHNGSACGDICNKMEISNCITGEIITLSGETMIISTSSCLYHILY